MPVLFQEVNSIYVKSVNKNDDFGSNWQSLLENRNVRVLFSCFVCAATKSKQIRRKISSRNSVPHEKIRIEIVNTETSYVDDADSLMIFIACNVFLRSSASINQNA